MDVSKMLLQQWDLPFKIKIFIKRLRVTEKWVQHPQDVSWQRMKFYRAIGAFNKITAILF